MTDIDDVMRSRLREAQAAAEADRVSDFASSWSAAEARAAKAGRRRAALTGSAVAATAAVIAMGLLFRGDDDLRYVDTAELLGTTSWVAPSDSLLPQRQFDIYQDIPLQMESTESNGGALL